MQTSEAIHPDKHAGTSVGGERGKIGAVRCVEQHTSYVALICEYATVLLQCVHAQILRVNILDGQEQRLDTTAAVLPDAFEAVRMSLTEDDAQLILATDAMTVVVERDDFALCVYDAQGALVTTLCEVVKVPGGQTDVRMKRDPADHFYGLGEKTGFLDKNGETYRMWNSDVYSPHVPEIKALYVSIPYVMHVHDGHTYALFLDHAGESVFDMQQHSDYYSVQTVKGDFDAYVIVGDSMIDVIREYTALTGRLHLPPAWSLGYHQSRYSYASQTEVMDLATSFREKGIPCDAIHLDIHYMDEYRVFTFDKQRFADPKGMVHTLMSQGFHVVPIVDPGVKRDPRYDIYQEGIAQDRFCKRIEGDVFLGAVWPGESGFPDFTDDATSVWWGEKHRFYTDMGISGIWNDMNEPAIFNESKTMDLDVMHRNHGHPKTHEELHNLYGMLMTKATYEGMRQLLGNQRPFLLTRAGYAGVQRYGAVWTGDNRSFWEHMEMAVPMVLNMGLSGVPFAGADIGGFAHDVSPELLVRWTQMGAFFPFFRNHSALGSVRQEPWSFGAQVEQICRKFIELRYRMMPYVYTLFYEASQVGMPVMRPLCLEYPQDERTSQLSDQFLLGRDLLVAPVFRPGVRKRMVYLPSGTWYNYWTDEEYTGEHYVLVDAPLDEMPLFVRSGAILPEYPVQSAVQFDCVSSLQFVIYGDPQEAVQSYVLYEDDGISFDHELGLYNELEVTYEATVDDGASVTYRYLQQGYLPAYRSRVFCFTRIRAVEQIAVEGFTCVTVEQLTSMSKGYAIDVDAGEVLVKLPADVMEARFVWRRQKS